MATNPANQLLHPADGRMFETLKRIDDEGELYECEYTIPYDTQEVIDAGIANVVDLFRFAGTRFVSGLDQILESMDCGCSCYTADNDGGTFLCRNFDYKVNDVAVLVVRTAPKNGYRAISLCDIACFGYRPGSLDDGKTDVSMLSLAPFLVTDGINEKGFCIAAMQLDDDGTCQRTGKPKIMTTIAMRVLLDRAASVDEAVALLKTFDMQSPNYPEDFHFILLDATGKTAIVEYVHNEMRVLDARYAANCYVSKDMYKIGHGQNRFELMEEVLEKNNYRLTFEQMIDLLRGISLSGKAGDIHNKYGSYTVWSSIYDPRTCSLRLCVKRKYAQIHRFGI